MSFFLVVLMYCQRVVINIAIVEMVEQTKKTAATSNNTDDTCPMDPSQDSVIKDIEGGKIDWSEQEQSYVLLSFYFGYTIAQLFSGFVCDKYGAKYPLLIGAGLSSAATCVLPIIVMSKMASWVPCLMRAVAGLAQAVLYPGITALLARWVPLYERGTLCAVAYSGNSIGIIVGTLGTGLMIHYLNNWTYVFYIWSSFGLLWMVPFWVWIYSDPSKHKNITPEELQLLTSTITPLQTRNAPFKSIFQDMAVWAIVVGQVGHDYIYFTLVTNLPKYMNNVLHYDIKNNSWASSLPFLTMYISSVICGKISDHITMTTNLNIGVLRKVATTISAIFPGLFVLLAGYANCNRMLSLMMFSVGLFFKGPYYSSLKVNCMDLTAVYAGNLMSIANGIGSLAGMATPWIIGSLAPDNTLSQWHKVFWVVFAVQVITSIFYIIFAKGKRAKWDLTYQESVIDLSTPTPVKKWYMEKNTHVYRVLKEERLRIKQEEKDKKIKQKEERLKAKKEKQDKKDAK
ncbi:PREDICTED: sialin-like [Nicrophorus vespilloides]|uniref:Sialin-like n=1 Tax=Nicrophorus vespilloides TaxID=110193 RepID=A0ABM1N6B5_NICVS|nr:PREDICTED: sialin-like [Nicrophorus vespilloides]